MSVVRYLSIGLLFLSSTVLAQQPVSIILDTDIGPDYDDVGALAVLHHLADRGEAKILGTISCNVFHTTAPTLSVLNTYFDRPEIPIGITKGEAPNKDCKQKWAEAIVEKYPHSLKRNEDAEDAIKLYRRILSLQPDKSVTVVSIGFFTNLANLLNSGGDEYSPLTGSALVALKVKQLVSMAGGVGTDGKGFREYNVWVDAKASQKVFRDWPTPMVLSPFEIGVKILTGKRLTGNNAIKDSPVKDAYTIALAADKNTEGRNSWDQTAVLVAIRGASPYFDVMKINFDITDDGTSVVMPGDRFSLLTARQSPEALSREIEDLMMGRKE